MKSICAATNYAHSNSLCNKSVALPKFKAIISVKHKIIQYTHVHSKLCREDFTLCLPIILPPPPPKHMHTWHIGYDTCNIKLLGRLQIIKDVAHQSMILLNNVVVVVFFNEYTHMGKITPLMYNKHITIILIS